jgi:hypothetical protein
MLRRVTMSRDDWLPKERKPEINKKGIQVMSDGEPGFVELTRNQGADFLSGYQHLSCCDCGLKHLQVFQVYKDKRKKEYTLVMRAWRL